MSFEYLSPTDHNLLCPLCLLPFTEPWMSATCEHVYCKICILEHLQTSETCPCDRRSLDGSIAAGQLVPAPRLVKLLCDELPVSCSVCSKWTGQRADWSRHTRVECGKDISVACKNGCGFRSEQASVLQEHHDTQCPKRSVPCESCNEEVLAVEAEVGPGLAIFHRARKAEDYYTETCSRVQQFDERVSTLSCITFHLCRAIATPQRGMSAPQDQLPSLSLRLFCFRQSRGYLKPSPAQLMLL